MAAAVPVAVKAEGDDTRLLALIHRYKAELAAIDAMHEEATWKDIDAFHKRARQILVKAGGLPVVTAAGALAVLDLVHDEVDISDYSVFGDRLTVLVHGVRGYLGRAAS